MTSDTPRCAPPEGTTRGTPHRLAYQGGDQFVAEWSHELWLTAHGQESVDWASDIAGWRYIAPCEPPEVVAALRASLEAAQNMCTAWMFAFGAIEAHLRDRIAMGDPANPTVYLNIIMREAANIQSESEQIGSARSADNARHTLETAALREEVARLRRALELIADGLPNGTHNGAIDFASAALAPLPEKEPQP